MGFDLGKGRMSLEGFLTYEDVRHLVIEEYGRMDDDALRELQDVLQRPVVTQWDVMDSGGIKKLWELSSWDKIILSYIGGLLYERQKSPRLQGTPMERAWGHVGMMPSFFIGEQYEDRFVEMFADYGAGRYRQMGIPTYVDYCPKKLWHLRADMMQKWQRDCFIWTANGRRLNVEIKSLGRKSLRDEGSFVGSIGKWDNKRFPVNICVIIKQETGEMLWTRADKQARLKWEKRESQQTSYLVPAALWRTTSILSRVLGYNKDT